MEYAEIEREINKLDRLHNELLADLNSFIILYSGELDDLIKEYTKFVNKSLDGISGIIIKYMDCMAAKNVKEKEVRYEKVKEEIEKLYDIEKGIDKLWKTAQKFLDERAKELER